MSLAISMSNGTEISIGVAAMVHNQSLSLLPRNAHSVPFVELRQSLASRVAAISPFVDQLMRFILKFRSADGSEIDIETALREALANAVIHGNRANSYKRVYVDCRCYMDGEISITVWDEGQGFDSEEVANPTTPENLLFTHGRGIYLMKTLMDEVSFEDGGSVVRMRKNSKGDFSPSNESSRGCNATLHRC
jgi:serine/threonine-protein kinase RsbW